MAPNQNAHAAKKALGTSDQSPLHDQLRYAAHALIAMLKNIMSALAAPFQAGSALGGAEYMTVTPFPTSTYVSFLFLLLKWLTTAAATAMSIFHAGGKNLQA